MIAVSLCELSREREDESQSVLDILHLGSLKQPIPVQVRVVQDHPWECFGKPCLQTWLLQSRQQQLRRVPARSALQVGESWITECSQRFRDLLRTDVRTGSFDR